MAGSTPRLMVSMTLDKAPPARNRSAERKQIEADVEAFLAAGGEIEQVPTGFTNHNAALRSIGGKQIQLKGSPLRGRR